MHALATGRSGCTHFALAISTTAPSASLEESHASGHLKSSALTEVSLAAARHAVERLGWRIGDFVGDVKQQTVVRRRRALQQLLYEGPRR